MDFLGSGIFDRTRLYATRNCHLNLRRNVIRIRWMIRVDVPSRIHRRVDDQRADGSRCERLVEDDIADLYDRGRFEGHCGGCEDESRKMSVMARV